MSGVWVSAVASLGAVVLHVYTCTCTCTGFILQVVTTRPYTCSTTGSRSAHVAQGNSVVGITCDVIAASNEDSGAMFVHH